MNPKTTIGLIIALVIALGGVWWAQSSAEKQQQKVPSGPRALFDPAVGEVVAFEIVQTAAGQPMKFETGEDKKWRMTAPLSGPAEQFMVNGDVEKVKQLQYIRSYPQGDADRPTDEMTSLQSPNRIVKLTAADGKVHVLKIGATQMLSSNTYVQKEGDPTIYLVNADLNKDLRRGMSEYRGKKIAEFAQADATRVEVTGQTPYVLVKSAMKWTVEQPAKARADAGKVTSLLSALSNLHAERFVEDNPASLRPYGLEPPRFAVSVTTESKKVKEPPAPPASGPAEPEMEVKVATVRLLIGAEAEESVFARLDDPNSPAVFQITKAVAKQIMQPLDDLRDRKVADIGPARIQKLSIAVGGQSVELTNTQNTWQITAGLPGESPQQAEFAAVDDVIKALRNLTATGFEPVEVPDQGFANPRAVIDAAFEGTVEPIRLIVGGTTPSGTGAYVKNEKENFVAVVKADQVSAFMATPVSFMTREMLRLTPENVSRMEFTVEGRSYAVGRQGDAWRMVEPIEDAAETAAVTTILNDLAMLRGRKVVGTATDAASFGLDAPPVVVALTEQTPPPDTQPTSQPETQPNPPAPVVHRLRVGQKGESVFATVEGSRTICEIDPKILTDLKAELLHRKVAGIEPSQIRRLTLTGERSMTFEKAGDTWRLAGEAAFAVDPVKISEVLNALRDLQAERFVAYRGASPGEFGLDQPAGTITVEDENGAATTLAISARGAAAEDRYATIASQAGRVFVISSENAAKFIRKVADFQKQG